MFSQKICQSMVGGAKAGFHSLTLKCTSNILQIKYHSNKHQMRMGLSNTNQMRLGYQIQIKCPQHQMHIKHTPNQMAIKYNEYNQMQLKYRSNTN